ncbi:uncharacterized protein [Chironomus tepperi]|uniref:uncharacterized protein n=1 Tax=Chironomus tepperi TaxID=113505 RepID=UPI00391F5165
MNKSNSGKKNPIKKSGRKDYMTHYEPLFGTSNSPEKRRSNSLTPDKTRRQTFPGDIPNILKRNIAALSESSDSIKLTDFGKSFVDDDKTPPKKKNKSLFDKLQYDDIQNIEIVPSGFENKHLKSVKGDLRPQVMFSSPSILNERPNISRSPEQKFPTNPVKSTAVDAFDKLKHSDNQLNTSKINSEDVVIIKENSMDEKTSNDNNKKDSSKEKSFADSSSSSSHSAIINKSIKIDENIIKNYRDSLNGFRQMLSTVKSIHDKVFVFRQELSEGNMCDFPSTQT